MGGPRDRDLTGSSLEGRFLRMDRTAKEKGGAEDVVLHERVGRPGLEVGAEPASGVHGYGVGSLLEVFDGDRCAKEKEGLRGFKVGTAGTNRKRGQPRRAGRRDIGLEEARSLMTLARPLSAARQTGVVPILVGVLTHAPSSANARTIPTWPCCTAMKTGVAPSLSGVLTHAPSLASSLTVSMWPFAAAT
eukprot:CAMPEP_0119527222 /NCGR_PEP_ID=MMETSP1344-20130328/41676_1 /TAXON_ID=236787 /ORGANISM="Florenciella parvula, Strain CCMP2471" /LENGTH=189 /DNA_ID=CAMNT_0007566381 /DNA_START=265 /DNA_END=835 /DNA_ORIENTATION=-